MSFTIDGIKWNFPCTIEREAEVTPSEISGMMLNKTYFNDVLGTWMKYTVAIAIPKGHEAEYTQIYEALSDPVSYHTFILPYNYQEEGLTINARVHTVSDAYVRLPNGKQTWRKTRFEIIANHPTKEVNDEEIVDYGFSPFPDTAGIEVGSVYEYTAQGWEQKDYGDGDNTYY